MVIKHPIKTINCTNGELFGIFGTRRRQLGACEPVITIYRQDNPVTVSGRVSYALKTWHIGVVLCNMELEPGMDYSRIAQVTRYNMTAEVLTEGDIMEQIQLSDLYPEWIDPRDTWKFSTEDQAKIDELLALRNR